MGDYGRGCRALCDASDGKVDLLVFNKDAESFKIFEIDEAGQACCAPHGIDLLVQLDRAPRDLT